MSRKKQTNQKITALYCRISLDDGGDNESMSISNQKLLLKDHAEKLGMFQYEYYVDDGYTGRNFNRPSFRRMIADIEAGKVGCVITKDLSRLGRNYIEAGTYIEIFFPKHNVRYIAVTDGVDSLTSPELDITPFKNILNDMYSRDISKKVLAGWMTRSRQGKFIGGTPPYGLMRDPNDNGHLIKDPEKAPVIRMIFDLALDGYGSYRIAKVLLEKKIPITTMRLNREVDANYYTWGASRITAILRNPVYYGAHTVCKTHQKFIRSNTVNKIPVEDREIIEGCHEPIVSKEEWLRVQKIIDARPNVGVGNSCPYYNIFRGLIVCGTCGRSMQSRYGKVGRTAKNRFTGEMREPIDKAFYSCQTYNRSGKQACTSHKIEARDLYNLVLADIQSLIAQVMTDPDAFYDKLLHKLDGRQRSDIGELQREYDALAERSNEIDQMILTLYEDKVRGVITPQRFVSLTEKLENEQKDARSRMQELWKELQAADGDNIDAKAFIEELKKHGPVQELDEVLLHRLIDKIIVGERQVVDGEKVQEVTIRYNFVGEISE